MERKAKVELFEQIRREYEFGDGTVLGIDTGMRPSKTRPNQGHQLRVRSIQDFGVCRPAHRPDVGQARNH